MMVVLMTTQVLKLKLFNGWGTNRQSIEGQILIARSPSLSSISSIMVPNTGVKVVLVLVIKVIPTAVLIRATSSVPQRLTIQTKANAVTGALSSAGAFSSFFADAFAERKASIRSAGAIVTMSNSPLLFSLP